MLPLPPFVEQHKKLLLGLVVFVLILAVLWHYGYIDGNGIHMSPLYGRYSNWMKTSLAQAHGPTGSMGGFSSHVDALSPVHGQKQLMSRMGGYSGALGSDVSHNPACVVRGSRGLSCQGSNASCGLPWSDDAIGEAIALQALGVFPVTSLEDEPHLRKALQVASNAVPGECVVDANFEYHGTNRGGYGNSFDRLRH